MKTSEFRKTVEAAGMALTVNGNKADVTRGNKKVIRIAAGELFISDTAAVNADLIASAVAYAGTPDAERMAGSDSFKLQISYLTPDDNRNFVMRLTKPRIVRDKEVKQYKGVFTRKEVDDLKKVYNLASFTEVQV